MSKFISILGLASLMLGVVAQANTQTANHSFTLNIPSQCCVLDLPLKY